MSSGAYHCCALTAAGELWTWGQVCNNIHSSAKPVLQLLRGKRVIVLQGLHGQLGFGSQTQAVHPTLVTKFAGKVVNAVRCGELHTLAAVEGTHLFASGNNLHGQLGFGDVICRMGFQEVC